MWCKDFWCQKVLPLVYDNSLSYYEVLCKLAKRIDEIGDAIDTTGFMKTTGDVATGRYYFNSPVSNPGDGTIIVNQNDAGENATVRVQNSGNKYGLQLRVSRTGYRGIIDSSAIIAEDGSETPANGVYKWLIYKDADNNLRIPQEVYGRNIGNLYQAQGSGSSTSLVADAFTQVTLTSDGAIKTALEDNFYEVVSGGIRVLESGVYKVCGGVYI